MCGGTAAITANRGIVASLMRMRELGRAHGILRQDKHRLSTSLRQLVLDGRIGGCDERLGVLTFDTMLP